MKYALTSYLMPLFMFRAFFSFLKLVGSSAAHLHFFLSCRRSTINFTKKTLDAISTRERERKLNEEEN
jgi:hypothetical protein